MKQFIQQKNKKTLKKYLSLPEKFFSKSKYGYDNENAFDKPRVKKALKC